MADPAVTQKLQSIENRLVVLQQKLNDFEYALNEIKKLLQQLAARR